MSPPPATRPGTAAPLIRRRRIPGWFIAIAVGITVVVTVVTVQLRGPKPARIDNPAWAEAMLPVVGAAGQLQPVPGADQLQAVAAIRGIPPQIAAGTRRPHQDRGACTRCHTVTRMNGSPMPLVTADSWMPHAYPGGMCINCHQALPAVFGDGAAPNAPLAAAGPAGTPAVLEASWQGLEVAPITPVNAQQFGTPTGVQGVVVTEVEGRASAAGLQAGDVVVAINGRQISDLSSFATVTMNGLLPQGKVQVLRGGRLFESWLEAAARPVATLPPTTVPAQTSPFTQAAAVVSAAPPSACVPAPGGL